jgi:hypothetical protein
MTTITASVVNQLRKMTGAGMMDCKKALQEANGDMDAAVDILRKKGAAKAAKRADRDAAEGLAIALSSADNSYGIVQLYSCQRRQLRSRCLIPAGLTPSLARGRRIRGVTWRGYAPGLRLETC